MDETRFPDRRIFGTGLAVSLLLHALAGVALLVEVEPFAPASEQAPIEVVLVPETSDAETPELPDPAPQEPETPEPETPEPEEPSPTAAPMPAPDVMAQTQEPPGDQPTPLPVLQPVVEFGDADGGSRIAPDGDAADQAEAPERLDLEAEDGETTEADPAESVEDEAADTSQTPEADLSEAVEPEILEPEAAEPGPSEPDAGAETGGEGIAGDFGTVGPIMTTATPAPKPEAGRRSDAVQPEGMREARRLYSDAILDDPRARTAMAGMPAGDRLNLLCMTELRAQLNAAAPPRRPEILPSFRPQAGTVLEPRQAAFRSAGEWYDLAFRCEVDPGVTKVVKFGLRVGAAIPRSQWQQRGFPSF
ncbi:DUF930 domain-containing protein [Polymorphum gilvum]|uniref:Conserved domain protein n=1 Tax=Polymorphum gilvum (strain LMG 25793 / CGMCC 1.9160 / SL003B-26A1) TaxID=991905 RepID=F2J0M8_POLGS|nr:DUF930 domain-containing protein [Polymorphum gilvum]ADZ69696.1 Conserved domain protein [Polymorphum gilvum SL003B-26A1]